MLVELITAVVGMVVISLAAWQVSLPVRPNPDDYGVYNGNCYIDEDGNLVYEGMLHVKELERSIRDSQSRYPSGKPWPPYSHHEVIHL